MIQELHHLHQQPIGDSGITTEGPIDELMNVLDYNISPKSIEKLINKNTKASLHLHLYGHSCQIVVIMKIAITLFLIFHRRWSSVIVVQ